MLTICLSYHQIILTDKDNDESNNLSTQTMIEINIPPEQEKLDEKIDKLNPRKLTQNQKTKIANKDSKK